jgi:hypothetical protein
MNAEQRHQHEQNILHVSTVSGPLVAAQTEQALLHARQDTKADAIRAATEETLTGVGRHWPEGERVQVVRSAEMEYATRFDDMVRDLGQTTRETEDTVARLVAQAEEPPTVEEAVGQRAGRLVTMSDTINAGILRELVVARLERTLADALPSAILGTYAAALDDPLAPANAASIEYVETMHRAGWRGRRSDDLQETADLLTLGRRIESARAGRVPQELRRVQQVVGKARAALARMGAVR